MRDGTRIFGAMFVRLLSRLFFKSTCASQNLLTSFLARCRCQRREHLHTCFTKKPHKVVLPNAAATRIQSSNESAAFQGRNRAERARYATMPIQTAYHKEHTTKSVAVAVDASEVVKYTVTRSSETEEEGREGEGAGAVRCER